MTGWIVKLTRRSGWRRIRFTLRFESSKVSDSAY
jgi:hypothetical protein